MSTLTGGTPFHPSSRAAPGGDTLDRLPIGQARRVAGIRAPADAPEWAERLAEIGFVPGERVMVMARGQPGGEPLAVRVGVSTFALRRAEAACVLLAAVGAEPARATPGVGP